MEKSALFINKLVEDQELQAALVAATQTAETKEEKIEATTKFANEVGFEVSANDLEKLVETIRSQATKISDDALANVAGGGVIGDVSGVAFDQATHIGGIKAVAGVVGGEFGDKASEALDGTTKAFGGAVETVVSTIFSGW